MFEGREKCTSLEMQRVEGSKDAIVEMGEMVRRLNNESGKG